MTTPRVAIVKRASLTKKNGTSWGMPDWRVVNSCRQLGLVATVPALGAIDEGMMG